MTIQKFMNALLQKFYKSDIVAYEDEEEGDYTVIMMNKDTKTIQVSFGITKACDMIYRIDYHGSYGQLVDFIDTVRPLLDRAGTDVIYEKI